MLACPQKPQINCRKRLASIHEGGVWSVLRNTHLFQLEKLPNESEATY